MTRKRITHYNTVVDVELYACRTKSREFDVYLIEGNWPIDNELIFICNHKVRADKGGMVDWGEGSTHKVVTVFM